MHPIRPGLRFSCTRCGRCCAQPDSIVLMSRDETRAMARHLKIDPRTFRRRYLTSYKGFPVLKSRPDETCVFYQNGCSIYPVRPVQCRTFPFWSDLLKSPRAWNKAAKKCPGMNQGRVWGEKAIARQSREMAVNLWKMVEEKRVGRKRTR
jgi:Fe-S-cluster containining protein